MKQEHKRQIMRRDIYYSGDPPLRRAELARTMPSHASSSRNLSSKKIIKLS